jgi:hypothetical protein
MFADSVLINVYDLMLFSVIPASFLVEFSLALFNPLSFESHHEGG